MHKHNLFLIHLSLYFQVRSSSAPISSGKWSQVFFPSLLFFAIYYEDSSFC